MVSYQSIMAMMASKAFQGCLVTVDLIPPFMIPFVVAPEIIDDDWSADYDYHSSPGSRYQYPAFKGCTPRVVTTILRFDQSLPLGSPGASRDIVHRHVDFLKGAAEILMATEIENVVAGFETLKLPKQGIAGVMQTMGGGFLRASPGVSDPSPPLVLYAESAFKMMLGYVNEAKITVTKRNRWMQPTRIEVSMRFLVTPDLIFTTIEDLKRMVYATKGFYMF